MKRILFFLFCLPVVVVHAAPPEPANEVKAQAADDISLRNLEELGRGVSRYLRARGQFPVLKNPLDWQARRAFYPYVGDENFFLQPEIERPYLFNEILSGKKPAHIPNPQSFAVFYEEAPDADGKRGVLFLDGHVERVIPAHWEKIKRASKIVEDTAPSADE